MELQAGEGLYLVAAIASFRSWLLHFNGLLQEDSYVHS